MFREEVILKITEGKDVLDCGGVDHWAYEQKLSNGEWLHERIHSSAKSCVGIDILSENVEKINKLGKFNFVAANVEELTFNAQFDVVVAGEIVEHLYNLGKFLDSAWRALKKDGTLIITTPNAFSISGLIYATLRGREQCHPEHTCYFSPQTLRYVTERHGFKIQQFYHADRPSRFKLISFFRQMVTRINPLLCETIVLVATKIEIQKKYENKW